MKCVILAGGLGTRISEESHLKPKPMIEIGAYPILWHIMKIYEHAGITEFVILLGYKGYVAKEYFANYFLHRSDVTIDLANNEMTYDVARSEPWRITLVDTGEHTMTGGRVRRARHYLEGEEAFCLTYGDGVGNVDIKGEIEFHKKHGLLATMTTVMPPGRFGAVDIVDDKIQGFVEKPRQGGLINGGFFICSPKVIDLIDGDDMPFEHEPLTRLVEQGQLAAWQHDGFWQPMDTLRDKQVLERLWESGEAPWKVWNDA